MARIAPGDTTVPPLIAARLGAAQRLVVPVTVSPAGYRVAEGLAASYGLALVQAPVVGTHPVFDVTPDAVAVHEFPDLFGRIVLPPEGLVVLMRHSLARPFVAIRDGHAVIEIGGPPEHEPRLVAGALAVLRKRLIQVRGVKPVFARHAPLAVPLIAQGGVTLTGGFGRAEAVAFPGLPDLVVVRPSGAPPAGTTPLAWEPMVVAWRP